jgi:hypothetical protein
MNKPIIEIISELSFLKKERHPPYFIYKIGKTFILHLFPKTIDKQDQVPVNLSSCPYVDINFHSGNDRHISPYIDIRFHKCQSLFYEGAEKLVIRNMPMNNLYHFIRHCYKINDLQIFA